jgi:opacity protein-like surface antigen
MKLRKTFITLLFCGCLVAAFTQNHIGVTLRLDAGKAWKPTKKLRFEVGQQIQVNPEFSRDQKKFGDIFNEINLFPDDDTDDDGLDDGDDPDNDDDDPTNPSQPLGKLDDRPYSLLWEWRTATNGLASYAILKWLRVEQSYSLNYRKGNDIRHTVRTQIRTTQKFGNDFELTQRIGFQTTSRKNKKKNITEWENDYVGRVGAEWEFKKKHILQTEVSVNGTFNDAQQWEWDRLRIDAGLRYKFTKVQSFDLSYRFQQTLDSKKKVSHGVALSFMLDF